MSFGSVVQCNAYSWEADGSCRLALLTSLEDPQPGQAGREVLLDSGAGLGRVCRGGDQCCRPDNQCGEGAGDCDTDQDCAGLLVCGSNNCGQAGGRWAALPCVGLQSSVQVGPGRRLLSGAKQ